MAKRTSTIAAALLAAVILVAGATQFFGGRQPKPGAPAAPDTPASPGPSAPAPAPVVEPALAAGDQAPAFSLPDANGKEFSLSQYLGKDNVLLFFHMGTG